MTQKEIETKFGVCVAMHSNQIIGAMLDKYHCTSFEALKEAEYNMAFGFDCGWIYIIPFNELERDEWKKASGDAYVFEPSVPFMTQSVTLKKFQAELMLKLMNLENDYFVKCKLD